MVVDGTEKKILLHCKAEMELDLFNQLTITSQSTMKISFVKEF